jgi:antirestriction protein ArdC
MHHGFKSRWWATWNQWKGLGGYVKRRPDNVPAGSWGSTIVYFSPVTKTKIDDDGEEVEDRFFVLRTYTVFNVDQVEGPFDHLRVGCGQGQQASLDERYEQADALIAATGADVRFGGNEAFYSRTQDCIQLPFRHQFATLADFYGVAFHELTHWTEERLGWDRAGNGYALGELIAEIGGCYLCSELGLPTAQALDNHMAYIAHWVQGMQANPRFIFTASAQASKAADYLLAFTRPPIEEPEAALTE